MVLNIFLGRTKKKKAYENISIIINLSFHFLSLLYGFSQPSSIYYYYRHYSFYYRADENGVKLPKIHLILCKVSSSSDQETKIGIGGNTPTAEEIDKCWRFVYDIYTKHRDAFETRTSPISAISHSLNERSTSITPRLSSISMTPSSYHEQRYSASTPVTPATTSHFHNHVSNSNSLTQPYYAQTFEEFMRQYVMHIGNETNVVSRIAVKSHSPLLPVRHPHQSQEYQICAQTFDKTLNDIVERI